MQVEQSEISLKELVGLLWRRRWMVLCFALVATLAAGTVALLVPKRYQSTTVISPVSDDPSSDRLSGLSSLSSQLGGLSSLAGLSVASNSHKSEIVAVLQSESLTETYIQKSALLPVLFQEQWDSDRNNWKSGTSESQHTLWKANDYFRKKIRIVDTDAKTGLVSLSITWTDPKLSARWANDLVRMTNDYLRSKAIGQAERNITYLNDQASKTDAIGAKQAIYTILQSEINKMMLAKGSDEFALKVIDPAVAPERASSPQPLQWMLAGFLGALAVSVFAAFVETAWSRDS